MPDGSAPSRARPRDVRRRAFEPLYRKHYAFVWRCLLGFGVRVDTEDAVQEVFVTAYRRLQSYEGRASMRGWLAGISRRVASRWRRTSERRQRRHAAIEPPDDVPDLDAWLRRKEAAVFLDAFLDELDADRRSVFVLCDLEGLRGREAAEALGLNQNTAYARLRSARASFEQACARLEQDGVSIAAAQVREARENPPAQRVDRAWAAFALQTGLGAAGNGGAAASVPLLAHLKVVAITVVVGGAGLGAVRMAMPNTKAEPPAVVRQVSSAVVPMKVDAPKAPVAREPSTPEPAEPVVESPPEPPTKPTPRPRKTPRPSKPSRDDGLSGGELEQLGRAHQAYAAKRYADAARIAEQLLSANPQSEVAPDARVVLVKAECGRGRTSAAQRAARALSRAEAQHLLAIHCAGEK